MFHVKRKLLLRALIGLMAIVVWATSCIGSRPATQITDYLLLPNGIESAKNASVTAFVFENSSKGISIERYLNEKFNTKDYSDREFNILIKGDTFQLILYDNAEFEKYFATSNLVVVNLEPIPNNSGRKFIAISVTDINGADALAANSLFSNIVTGFLKDLKDDFHQYD